MPKWGACYFTSSVSEWRRQHLTEWGLLQSLLPQCQALLPGCSHSLSGSSFKHLVHSSYSACLASWLLGQPSCSASLGMLPAAILAPSPAVCKHVGEQLGKAASPPCQSFYPSTSWKLQWTDGQNAHQKWSLPLLHWDSMHNSMQLQKSKKKTQLFFFPVVLETLAWLINPVPLQRRGGEIIQWHN